MNKTQATHALYLSQEEFELVQDLLADKRDEMMAHCNGCRYDVDKEYHQHTGRQELVEALCARLDAE